MGGTETPHGGSEPGMTFESLVMLFGTAGLVHLGAAPDPAGGGRRVDLDQAQQAIEVLEVLKDKTVGNLSTSEAVLLEGVLFDLRRQYVEASRQR